MTPAFPDAPDDAFCRRPRRRLARAAGAAPALCQRHLPDPGAPAAAGRRRLPGAAGQAAGRDKAPTSTANCAPLHATREAFAAALAPYGPRTLSLYDGPGGALRSEPAEFLSLILNGELRPVLAPTGDLGQALADAAPELRPRRHGVRRRGHEPASFGAMISLKDYPARTAPGLLDGVLRLPLEMVLTESFAFVERQQALRPHGPGAAPPARRRRRRAQPARRTGRRPATTWAPAAPPMASIT